VFIPAPIIEGVLCAAQKKWQVVSKFAQDSGSRKSQSQAPRSARQVQPRRSFTTEEQDQFLAYVDEWLKQLKGFSKPHSTNSEHAPGPCRRSGQNLLCLFVDEAHFFKNLFYISKMTRIAGLPQTAE
jgi:hypothetical protein